ncbi:DUF2341 domain-containing protein [Prolixibacteraceae bacterium JC049]|nr:DUF2341 domain-containing protein [Prolixibacteraceae bacterium JC049]
MQKIILLLTVLLLALTGYGQNVIWSEYFNVYPNESDYQSNTYNSDYNIPGEHTTPKWTVSDENRVYVEGRLLNFELRTSGTYSFTTEIIQTDNFSSLSISMLYSTSGSGDLKGEFKLYYKLNDSGNWIEIEKLKDKENSSSITEALPNANKLQFKLQVKYKKKNKRSVIIDNIELKGGFTGVEGNAQINGKLKAEYWNNIAGNPISNLTNDPRYPDNPSSSELLSQFDAPRDRGSNFGGKLSGYIVPPQTGYYNFLIASDDNSEFRISPDNLKENLPGEKEAYVEDWTSYQDFWDVDDDDNGRNDSDSKTDNYHTKSKLLIKGKPYYFEGLYKQGGGGNHFSVAWIKPGSNDWEIIPSSALSSVDAAPVTLSLSGTNLKCFSGGDGKIIATATGGVTPLQYALNGGVFQNIGEFVNLAAGDYEVTVRDAVGTEKKATITLIQPSKIELTVTQKVPDCGSCKGEAMLKVAGGLPPYQLNWSGNSSVIEVKNKRVISFQGHEVATDYQLELNVTYLDKMQSDFDDLRFVDEEGNSLSYWVEEYTTSGSAVVWVKIPKVKIGLNKIEMHYGDASAVSESNIESVLISGGLNVEYYNNNSLSGTSVKCIDTKVLDYSYSTGQDVVIGNCGSNRDDNISFRWTGWIKNPSNSSSLYWNANTDDGFRMYLNGSNVYDHWTPQAPIVFSFPYTFPSGKNIVRFKYEFFENSGNAYARLGFSNNDLGANNQNNIGTKVPNDHYYYRNIISHPPSDIVFGEEQENQYVKTGLCAGDYTVTVSDANNCSVTTSVTIQKVGVQLNLNGFDGCARPSGNGSDDVKAVANVTGGSGNYQCQFLFDGNIVQPFGASNEHILNPELVKGNHVVSVQVKDVTYDNCELSAEKSITVHDLIQTNPIGVE